MRNTRRAATVAVSVSLALAGVTAEAHADSMVLYVEGSSTSCTDSGTGTQAAPFCTIQAAADAAVGGDTVEIAGGTYAGQVDIKSVGTAAAPIVFRVDSGVANIEDGTGQTGPALSFDGASYVDFEGGHLNAPHPLTYRAFEIYGLTVAGSSHITLNGVAAPPSAASPVSVHIAGTSFDVSLTRSATANVIIDSGSSGDVISTDAMLDGLEAVHGIDITGASNTVVTSNTIEDLPASANAISVSGGSTGTTIENNIVTYPQATTATAAPAVAVDASSAAGTTLDYNVVYGGTAQTDYSWAGTDYQTAAALFAASGQGAHDVNADPLLYYSGTTFLNNSAPEINSANASAPGMLSTDFFGLACSGDPLVAITGAGTPADCARGAIQQTYSPSVTAAATAQGGLGVSLATTITETAANGGGPPRNVYLGTTAAVSYTINWGDGHSQTAQASSTAAQTSTPHTYAKPGTYTITDTASLTTGGTVSTTTSFTTAGSSFTAMKPTRIFDTRNGTGTLQQPLDNGNCTSAQVTGVDGIPAGITAVAVNLTVTNTVGNGLFVLGSGNASNLNYSAGQTVANSAIVPLPADGRFDVCVNGNVGTHADAIIDVAGYFSQSTGAGFQPTAPDRVLDTRVGTGAAKAKIGAKSSVSVPIVGVDSIPADATAVAVHVTETNATGGGFIAAEPDGSGVPTTSSLNYGPGQTISNTVIVPIAADGKIELYNGALTGSVDLIADVSGYFSPTAPDAFMPVTPYRAVDTRLTTGSSLASDSTESFALGATTSGTLQSIPPGATMAANLTATDETAGGSLIVYAGGTPRPDTSALNFGKGQNIAGFGLFATAGGGDSISVYNDSPGSTDLVADVFGYFAAS